MNRTRRIIASTLAATALVGVAGTAQAVALPDAATTGPSPSPEHNPQVVSGGLQSIGHDWTGHDWTEMADGVADALNLGLYDTTEDDARQDISVQAGVAWK